MYHRSFAAVVVVVVLKSNACDFGQCNIEREHREKTFSAIIASLMLQSLSSLLVFNARFPRMHHPNAQLIF